MRGTFGRGNHDLVYKGVRGVRARILCTTDGNRGEDPRYSRKHTRIASSQQVGKQHDTHTKRRTNDPPRSITWRRHPILPKFHSAPRGTANRRLWLYLVKREHVARNIPFCEPSSGIRKKVPPFPLKRLKRCRISEPGVPLRHRIHRHIGFQSATPFSERPRIMSPVVLDELHRKTILRCLCGGVYQRCGAWKRGVWPHVSAHEVLGLVSPVTGFRERRGSDDGCGVLVFQCPVYKLEVGFVVLGAHMLR